MNPHYILRLYLSDKPLLVSDRAHLVKKNSIVAVSNTDDTEPWLNFKLHYVTLEHVCLLDSSWATAIFSICQEENEQLLAMFLLNNLLSNILKRSAEISSAPSLNNLNLALEVRIVICL